MIDNADMSVFDAFKVAEEKEVMPTSLSTEELRELPPELRARSFFTARGTSAAYAQTIRDVALAGAAGDIGESEMRLRLLNKLNELGYTPENGFPDSPLGAVPPAERGTLQDLSSFRRLDLIVRTQLDLLRGAGQQLRGHDAGRLEAAPCWELYRDIPTDEPRNWIGRFQFAGGQLSKSGRMIAPKGDPIWGELGNSDNFDDSLDVDYPPFAFNSGMWLREVSGNEARAEGVVSSIRINDPTVASSDAMPSDFGDAGNNRFLTPEEFLATRPRTLRGELPLPSPKLSIKNLDPKLAEQVIAETRSEDSSPGYIDYSDLLLESLQEADAAYGRDERETIDQYRQ